MTFRHWLRRLLRRGLALALALTVLVGPVPPAARAQTLFPLVVTPAAVGAGGEFQVGGAGWPIGTFVAFQLRRNGAPVAPLADTDTGRAGRFSLRIGAPVIDPGDYSVVALNARGVPMSAPVPLKITPRPRLTLSPNTGAPGTVVAVTVSNLLPGSLIVTYGGRAVIGPVAVAGGTYSGLFVVPSLNPPVTGEVAVSAFSSLGRLSLGVDGTTFIAQAGSPRPLYSATRLVGPTAAVSPGGAFTMEGLLSPVPVGPLDQISLSPFWSDAEGRRFPIGAGPAIIRPDGSFQVAARAPSRLLGDPVAPGPGGRVGVEIRSPGGTTVQTMTMGLAQLERTFKVRVVKDRPGAPDNGQPVPNLPKPAPGAPPPVQVLIEPLDSFHITQAQLDAAISPGEGTPVLDTGAFGMSDNEQQALKNSAVRIANCYQEVAAIPEWEWRMSPEDTVFSSLGATPGLSPIARAPLSGQAGGRPALAGALGGNILVQSFRVTVDASRVVDGAQRGYGEVDDKQTFVPTVRHYLYIPSQGRGFLLDEATGVAGEVPLPARVALPPLPAGWKSLLGIRYVDVTNDGAPLLTRPATLGPFYSFAGEPDITFEQVHPAHVRVALNQLPTGVPTVRMRFNGASLSVAKVVDEPPPAQSSPCAGSAPVTFPASDYTFYETDLPNTHLLPSGIYTLTVEVSDGANTSVAQHFPVEYVGYQEYSSWFDGPQEVNSRRVIWWPTSPILKGVPFRKSDSRGKVEEDVEDLPGPQTSTSSLSGELITQLAPPRPNPQPWESFESPLAQSGSMEGSSLDNATNPQAFGTGSSPALAAAPAGSSSGGDTFTILDTGRVTIFKAGYGIPEIAFIGISVDFRVRATLAINYTLNLNDIGLEALLDTTVDVRIKVDVDVLLGLADAEVGVNPLVGVNIPLKLSASKGTADLGACFHYAMDLYYKISILWGLGSWDGKVNVFKGSEPDACGPKAGALLRGAVAQADGEAVPETSPAVATDGLGSTMAVWRTETGDIASSLLTGGGWGPAATVVANGKSGNPAVAFFAPGRAVAVWSQSGLAAAPAEGTPLAEVLRQQHLAYAIWDGQAWSAPQSLTQPAGGDGKAALAGCVAGAAGCPAGGAVTAVWVHDAAGDYTRRQFRVLTATYQGGAWGPATAVDSASGASETEPQVIYKGGQPMALWVRDGDRSAETTADRRMALRFLGSSPVVVPAGMPAGVLRPRVALDNVGQLQVAFTTITPGDGIVGNRHVLQRAVGSACAAQLDTCAWGVEQVKDSLGRTIFAESPVVAVDSANRVLLTYRAMGMSPFQAASGPGAAMPEPVGLQTLTGELAQLELGPAIGGAVGLPSYLTDDGAVNWRPAAVYDPQLDSLVTLAVKGPAPAIGGGLALSRPRRQSAAPPAAPAGSLAFSATPRLPDFALVGLTPGERGEGGVFPASVTASLQNVGATWPEIVGLPPVVIEATWDGPPGVGAPAGQATIEVLGAGQAAEVAIGLRPPPGSPDSPHTLFVTVNTDFPAAEASGDNNRLSLELGRLPAPEQLYAAAAPGAATVQLTWAAADDPRVVGYRIYRVGPDGARAAVGSSFEPAWADLNAAFGQAYRYEVTSFSADLSESAPSLAAAATPTYAPSWPQYLPLIRR